MSLKESLGQSEEKAQDNLGLRGKNNLEKQGEKELLSSKLQNITPENRVAKIAAINADDLKTQADWLQFFKEMKELVPLLYKIPAEKERYVKTLLKTNIFEGDKKELATVFKERRFLRRSSILLPEQKQEQSLISPAAKKIGEEIDFLNDATKVYLEAIRRVYPAYRMEPSEYRRCELRAKVMWENLKANPEFDANITRFVQAKDTQEKIDATQKISLAIAQSMKPFFQFDDFKVVPYEDAGRHGLQPSSGFAPWDSEKEFHLNTYPEAFKHYNAAFISDVAAHEITHITQFARMKHPEAFKNNPYFSEMFTQILTQSRATYEGRYDLEQIRLYLNSQNINVPKNAKEDDLSYRHNPMEQEASLVGILISMAVQNRLVQKGLAKDMDNMDNYGLEEIDFAPYKNLKEVLSLLGEKPALSEAKNQKHLLNDNNETSESKKPKEQGLSALENAAKAKVHSVHVLSEGYIDKNNTRD